MSRRAQLIAVEDDIDVMVAADSLDPIAERIERMVKSGRTMALAVREFTYLGRPPQVHVGLTLCTSGADRGFAAGRIGDSVFCHVRLTNGGDRLGDTATIGFSERIYSGSGNETEYVAWKRYLDHDAESDSFSRRRRGMTHISFTGGLPGRRYQTNDQIVITRWNRDGVATEKTLAFGRDEGSWVNA